MVFNHERDHPSKWAAVVSIAEKAEAEDQHYAAADNIDLAACLTTKPLRQTRRGSIACTALVSRETVGFKSKLVEIWRSLQGRFGGHHISTHLILLQSQVADAVDQSGFDIFGFKVFESVRIRSIRQV